MPHVSDACFHSVPDISGSEQYWIVTLGRNKELLSCQSIHKAHTTSSVMWECLLVSRYTFFPLYTEWYNASTYVLTSSARNKNYYLPPLDHLTKRGLEEMFSDLKKPTKKSKTPKPPNYLSCNNYCFSPSCHILFLIL